MANSKQKLDPQSNKANSQPLTPEEAQAAAEAQVDLMGDAAVDPRPLMNKEQDAIADEVKTSNSD